MPSISDLDYDQPVGISSKQIKTVAIIGGGASAAITLDSLLREPNSSIKHITIFERQDKLGGVWYFNPKTIKTPNHIIKSGNNNLHNDPPLANPFHIHRYTKKIIIPKHTQERFVQTPSYQGITTNIIEKMMTYSDVNNWGIPGDDDDDDDNDEEEERKYVAGTVVQEYIEKYIERNLHDPIVVLKLNTTVEDVEKVDRERENDFGGGVDLPYRFKLTLRTPHDERNDFWYQQEFDTVIVASGHYHVPYIPFVPGLAKVQELFPDVVQHAKFYRDSAAYKNKSAIVVGSRASGSDLTKFVAREPGTTVYQSFREIATARVLSSNANVFNKPAIKKIDVIEYNEHERKKKFGKNGTGTKTYKASNKSIIVTFEDDSTVENPDHIIYCTGYLFSYPFLNRLFNDRITNEGATVRDLYQHTFLIHEPLINIIGVPIDGISFRVFEYQAVLLARYLTGKIQLPSRNKQLQWVAQRFEEKQNTRAFHTIGVTDALDYALTLTKLGQVSEKTSGVGLGTSLGLNLGREFPVITPEDVAIYRAAGEHLRKFWDER